MNSLTGFMIYVMMLAGIKLFLRIQEVIAMTIDKFETVYQVIDERGIQGLCVRVKGKTDPDWVYLMIWKDEKNPEFCLLRHLLVWISLAGIKSGSIFPHPDDIGKDPHGNGHYERPCDYDWFLGHMKHLIFDILKKDREEVTMRHIIGTHVLRKTAYLFAIFGCRKYKGQKQNEVDEIDRSMILTSARHKDIKCIHKYVLDCGTIWSTLKRSKSFDKHQVSAWEPIHINTHTTMRTITTEFTAFQQPVTILASSFVSNTLKIHPNMPKTVSFYMDRAMAYIPDSTPKQELDSELNKFVPEDQQGKFQEIFENYVQERLRAAKFEAHHPPMNATTPARSIPIQDEPSAKRRRVDKNDLEPKRSNVKKSESSKEQIESLLEIEEEVDGKLMKLTDGARRWYRRVKPILMCFETCCANNVECFSTKYPNKLTFTKFTCWDGKVHQFKASD
jgi:hypothetical protein